MPRIHLFEFTDQTWYPRLSRRMQTDYLLFVASLGSAHHFHPLLVKALQSAGSAQIIDLCSGGAGPWPKLLAALHRSGVRAIFLFTDKYPNPATVQHWLANPLPGIQYSAEPVDALHVSSHLEGMRTLFEGFHHFKPTQARSILQDAFDYQFPIAIFEITLKPPFGVFLLLLSPVMTLLSYLLLTSWIKPRILWRFCFTYLLPVVPLATC